MKVFELRFTKVVLSSWRASFQSSSHKLVEVLCKILCKKIGTLLVLIGNILQFLDAFYNFQISILA